MAMVMLQPPVLHSRLNKPLARASRSTCCCRHAEDAPGGKDGKRWIRPVEIRSKHAKTTAASMHPPPRRRISRLVRMPSSTRPWLVWTSRACGTRKASPSRWAPTRALPQYVRGGVPVCPQRCACRSSPDVVTSQEACGSRATISHDVDPCMLVRQSRICSTAVRTRRCIVRNHQASCTTCAGVGALERLNSGSSKF